jgi:transposase-like protein
MSRVTRETWAKRVERWQDSGLTIAEFAREAGLNARSLSWWRWQLTTKASEEPAVKASETLAVKPGEQPAAPRRRRARASKPLMDVNYCCSVATTILAGPRQGIGGVRRPRMAPVLGVLDRSHRRSGSCRS